MTFSQQFLYILVTVLLAVGVGYLSYYSGYEEGQKHPEITIRVEKASRTQIKSINKTLNSKHYRKGMSGWRIEALYAEEPAYYVAKRLSGFAGNQDRYGIWLVYGKNQVDSLFSANGVARAVSKADEKQFLKGSLLRSIPKDPSYLKLRNEMRKRLIPGAQKEGFTWARVKQWFLSVFN